MTAAPKDRVVVARFGAPHGVRGEIRLRTFTAEPGAVGKYGPLLAANGRQFEIEPLRSAGPDMLVVRVAGVTDRGIGCRPLTMPTISTTLTSSDLRPWVLTAPRSAR
jgi:ribosomal 30S subunit maturation factor RimM